MQDLKKLSDDELDELEQKYFAQIHELEALLAPISEEVCRRIRAAFAN